MNNKDTMVLSCAYHYNHRIILLILVLILSVSKNISAQSELHVLGYHPNSKGLALGKSFDLFNPSIAYSSDIFNKFDTIKSGTTKRAVYMSVINNRESFFKTMHVDASMNASFLSLFHTEGAYSNTETQLFSANSMTICIIGEADYGDFRIAKPELNKDVIDLSKKTEVFKENFGEFYVSSVHKMQSLYVFITLTNMTQSMKQQMSAELGASVGFLPFTMEVQGKVTKIVEQFRSSNSVHISVQSFGRNNIENLPLSDITDDFYRNGTFSANTYNAVLKYITENFSEQYGSDVEYSYSPLSQFGYLNNSYFDKIGRKYQKYINLSNEYSATILLENEVNQTLTCSGYSLVTSADRSILKKRKKEIGKRLDELSDALAKCRASTCDIMTNCCEIPEYNDSIDQNELDAIRNRYLSPLGNLSSVLTGNPLQLNLQIPYPNGGFVTDLFAKQDKSYSLLNINPNNQHTYVIESAFDFQNGLPTQAIYGITILINGVSIGTSQISVDGNAIGHYYFKSQPYSVGQKFSGQLPQYVDIHIELIGFRSSPNAIAPYIIILPYSKLLFNF